MEKQEIDLSGYQAICPMMGGGGVIASLAGQGYQQAQAAMQAPKTDMASFIKSGPATQPNNPKMA